ncbi:cysteine desulfurase [Candidatus Dojkabacteria bacterium]|nr:cysteine desulfurase [Candidatus Dojkabacteria bacterium]
MYKSDFPIFKNNPNLVYLDSAATSQKPQSVIDAIKDYYENYNSNIHRGIYKISEQATDAYEKTRKKIAKFINAKSEKEIIFTRNTTESINLIAKTWGKENVKAEDKILISEMEHHSNILPWQQLSGEQNICLRYINVRDHKLDIQRAEAEINETKPALLAITHVSNSLGTINPVKKLAEIAHKNGGMILIDGAQSVPHMQVDVQSLDADFLAFSGHKMLGPTGIGVLYVKEEILKKMNPFLTGGGMIKSVSRFETEFADHPYKFEAGTPDIAGTIGLSAAIDYMNTIGIERIETHERNLTKYALKKLSGLSEVTILGLPFSEDRAGVISIVVDEIHPHDIAQLLDENNIAVRAGHHCNHILMKDVLKVTATTRISFHIYNDENDIDRFVESLKSIMTKIKR